MSLQAVIAGVPMASCWRPGPTWAATDGHAQCRYAVPRSRRLARKTDGIVGNGMARLEARARAEVVQARAGQITTPAPRARVFPQRPVAPQASGV